MNPKEMSVDEARMVWLTMLGSDWVDQDLLIDAPYDSPLDVAANILDYEALLEFNYHHYTVRLRCKS